MNPRQAAAALATAATIACWCGGAEAFRPFDGTDASVADTGKVEVEFGPVEYLREGAERMLFAPSTRLNYGFAPGWEGTVEGRLAHGLSADARGTRLVEDAASLKGVLREGVLQEKSGPSVAAEFGLLLPGVHADRGMGVSLAGIVSERWEWATLHFNAAVLLTREQHAGLFLSTIAEGPRNWPVRPVAEVFYERDFAELRTRSALIGAIWQAQEDVAVDIGFRGGRVNDRIDCEIRAGVTFAFAVR